MRRGITRFTIGLLCLTLMSAVLLVGVESFRLKWWSEPENEPLTELTADQKAADMRYLLDLTRQVTPAEVVWEQTGMDNPLRNPEAWIERARQTPSNSAFADLVLQYLVHIGQGGHAYLAFDVQYNPVTSLISDIPRDAFAKMPRWGSIISQLPWNAHADLDIVYREGQYILNQESSVEGKLIPAGAMVETVDGLEVDRFVMDQQYRTHLRYDPLQRKFFIFPLFGVDPGPDRSGWLVSFRFPDQSMETVMVKKIPGYVAHRPDESQVDNIRCLALRDDTLYIKINTFYRSFVDLDARDLRQCFSSGQYQSVIFDVRGNNGGEIWSYMDNIIAPLIDQPITYQAVAANRESFYAWHNWRFWLYQLENDNELTDARAHVAKVERITYPPYSDQGWHVVRVTRRIQPAAEPFPFHGQVYVLTDNNALSAGDSFASAMQQTGLAKIVGTNTVGWGQVAQAKMLYGLPNSGILFYADSELIFNPDGSLNNYTGVMPDVFLDGSAYPTPYPFAVTREALLADAWVQWVLSETLESGD